MRLETVLGRCQATIRINRILLNLRLAWSFERYLIVGVIDGDCEFVGRFCSQLEFNLILRAISSEHCTCHADRVDILIVADVGVTFHLSHKLGIG